MTRAPKTGSPIAAARDTACGQSGMPAARIGEVRRLPSPARGGACPSKLTKSVPKLPATSAVGPTCRTRTKAINRFKPPWSQLACPIPALRFPACALLRRQARPRITQTSRVASEKPEPSRSFAGAAARIAFYHQAELDRGIGEHRRTAWTSGQGGKPRHILVEPDQQRFPPLKRFIAGLPVRRAVASRFGLGHAVSLNPSVFRRESLRQ